MRRSVRGIRPLIELIMCLSSSGLSFSLMCSSCYCKNLYKVTLKCARGLACLKRYQTVFLPAFYCRHGGPEQCGKSACHVKRGWTAAADNNAFP